VRYIQDANGLAERIEFGAARRSRPDCGRTLSMRLKLRRLDGLYLSALERATPGLWAIPNRTDDHTAKSLPVVWTNIVLVTVMPTAMIVAMVVIVVMVVVVVIVVMVVVVALVLVFIFVLLANLD
jgi:hypothetical protein